MDQEIKVFKTKPNKVYKLVKLREDGRQEFRGVGKVWDNEIVVGRGAVCATWATTMVQHITLTGKGCIFETLNSTYLLEEFDNMDKDGAT